MIKYSMDKIHQPVLNKKDRIWELDFIRGFCICLMIMDHTLFDLAFIFKNRWFADGETSGFFYWLCDLARTGYFGLAARDVIWYLAVFCFVFICGISCSFSRSNLKRGWKLAGVAVLLSLFTYLLDFTLKQEDEFTIRFGILHMLAASILLYWLIQKLDLRLRLLIAILAIGKGIAFTIDPLSSDIGAFAVFIETTGGFYSADYFSLLPWFGYFLLGASLGPLIYKEKSSFFPRLSRERRFRPVLFVGRHSLLFYLFHQPVVYLLLLLIEKLVF